MCYDTKSPIRDWFYAADPSVPRIISSYLAPLDERLYPNAKLMEKLQEGLAKRLGISPSSSIQSFADALHRQWTIQETTHEQVQFDYDPQEQPAQPHAYFMLGGIEKLANISRNQERLNHGPTISGLALQLAFIMGASEIHLYGCEFNNPDGSYYTYPTPATGVPGIRESHITNMDTIIERVMQANIPVYVHGQSKLTQGI